MKTDFCILEGSQGIGLGGSDGFGGSEGFVHTGEVNCLEAATTDGLRVFCPQATSRGNLAKSTISPSHHHISDDSSSREIVVQFPYSTSLYFTSLLIFSAGSGLPSTSA